MNLGPLTSWIYFRISLSSFCCSVTQSCLTLWDPMDWSTLGSPVLHHLLEFTQFMSNELVMPSNHLIIWHPLLLLPSIFPYIRDFSDELAVCVKWPKYRSFSFSISPSNEYLGMISLKIDWFDLAVQGTFRSLLQHRSLKASILQHSAFFMAELLQLYMTTGKTIILTIWTFIGKVMCLLFNTV